MAAQLAIAPGVGFYALALVPFLFPPSGGAQQPDRVVRAVRVDREPLLDGALDEALWDQAPVASDFRQRDPVEGAPASEETRVRLVYTRSHLYLGVKLLDSRPEEIRASELRRDNPLESDDSFAVLFDTFHDRRNAFLFRVNPRGTRFDGIVRNELRYVNSEWDEEWRAAARITDRGWELELEIPFKILRFSGDETQIWGVNFERVIKRKNEFVYWSGWSRDFTFTNVSQAGVLRGLTGIHGVERVRIRPYGLAGFRQFDATPDPERGVERDFGIDDLKVAVTPNVTADLTWNPDFAQTEVDAQQVNLTRFSLFFPEKRQFFVEGADAFRMGIGLLHFGPPPLELFYSRRIGLSAAGEPIPLLGGGKLTGTIGKLEVGALGVQSDTTAVGPGETFAAARFRREVLPRSYVGGIVTDHEGAGRYNRVGGVDARFVFFKYLNVAGLLARSVASESSGTGWAAQLGAEWRSDLLEAGANFIQVDPTFEAGIGFVRRKDRMVGGRASFKPRPRSSLIRQFELTPSLVFFHEAGNVLISRRGRTEFAINLQSGDRAQFFFENNVERLPRPFPISPGVTLPVDRYEWSSGGMDVRTYNGRRVSGVVRVELGGFYNGSKRSVAAGVEFRPNRNVFLHPMYSFNDVNLVQGSFDTHLVGLLSSVSFTRDLLSGVYVQYNSAGDLVATQVRFNYIFRTIDNLYVVYNETRYTDGVFADQLNRSLVVKATYSLRR